MNVQDLTPSCAGALFGEFLWFLGSSSWPSVWLFQRLIKISFLLQVLWIWWALLWVCSQSLTFRSVHCWAQGLIPDGWCLSVLHRGGAGVFIRIPDWSHTVVVRGLCPHHFSKCHGSRCLPHLWRCPPCGPSGVFQDYWDMTQTNLWSLCFSEHVSLYLFIYLLMNQVIHNTLHKNVYLYVCLAMFKVLLLDSCSAAFEWWAHVLSYRAVFSPQFCVHVSQKLYVYLTK